MGSSSIRIYGRIENDCLHIKNKLTCRLAGIDREEIREAYAFNEDGEFIGIEPKVMYEQHKPGRKANHTRAKFKVVTGKKMLPKAQFRSRRVAYNLSGESHLDLLKKYKLTKNDTIANLYTAAQSCKDNNAMSRDVLLQQHGPKAAHIIGGDNYLGILRYQMYDDPSGNRGTTPVQFQFFTHRSVQIYHEIARHGRACIHIDGSKSRVKFGATVKDGDKIQNWQMYLSPVSIQRSHSNDDPNKFLCQNFSPKLLSEFHSASTPQRTLVICSYASFTLSLLYARSLHVLWL
jgi:hypothetical protein